MSISVVLISLLSVNLAFFLSSPKHASFVEISSDPFW